MTEYEKEQEIYLPTGYTLIIPERKLAHYALVHTDGDSILALFNMHSCSV